jgi:hypothetical protein
MLKVKYKYNEFSHVRNIILIFNLRDIILMAKIPGAVLVAGIVENTRGIMGKAVLCRAPPHSSKVAYLRSMPFTATRSGAHDRQLEARVIFAKKAKEVKGKTKEQFGGQIPAIAVMSGWSYEGSLTLPHTRTARVDTTAAMEAELRRRRAGRTGGGIPMR